MTSRLEVGRVGRAHGLRGETAVQLMTEREERVAPGSVLFAGDRELVVVASRPHQGRWLVRFEGIEDRTSAEALLGQVLTADAQESADDELWVHELVGAEVRDVAGNSFGPVRSIEANPASDLLVLDGEVLVPLRFVVSREPGLLVIDPPDGLLDVNR